MVGELQPGPAQGSYVLRGKDGGPAMLVLGNEGVGSGEAVGTLEDGVGRAVSAISVADALGSMAG